jgi:hypothetical protein
MSKSSRQKSTNPDYEVGYCRPPVDTRYPPDTSGNPGGRPPKAKAKRRRKLDAASGLSAIQRAVLNAGAAKVEVRRGGRTVKMTQLEAAVEGLAEAARNGNVRAVQVLFQIYAEAEAQDRWQSIEVDDGRELALRIADRLRAAKRDGPGDAELEPQVADVEDTATRLCEAPQPTSYQSSPPLETPPDGECPGATPPDPLPAPSSDAPVDAAAPSIPTPARQGQPIMRNASPTNKAPRRRSDPLVADCRPIKAGGWGVSG